MRRVASAVVIAAVAAVAIVAAVDAVDRAPERELRLTSLRLHFPDARTVMRGRLLWIDARCRLQVTDIATLRQLEKPRRVSCRAGLDSSGRLTRRRDGSPLLDLSPDERWAISAGRQGLFLFRPSDLERRFRRLPIVATAVAWVP